VSYVSIWKPVDDRIVQASRDTRSEIIGLLLGRLEDDTIIIDDSITGEFSSEPHRATLPAATLAKIADQIVNGRIKGNIVGWYHSHTEGGVFFSDTDRETQRNLQQFSSLITAMVVDAKTGAVGYFRVDMQSGKTITIPEDHTRRFTEPAEAIPPEQKAKAPLRPTPTIEVRPRLPGQKEPISRLAIAIIIIALIASLSILGAVFFLRAPSASMVTISSAPILEATIGTPVEVRANLTGSVRNVTLFYSTGTVGFTRAVMNQSGPGEYQYVIPGEQVTGSLTYYVTAFGSSGNQVSTSTYVMHVADFAISAENSVLTVYRTHSVVARLDITPINGFAQQLELKASTPPGVTASFLQTAVYPGTVVQMNLTATSNAPNGTFPIAIIATYSPLGAQQITHQASLMLTIADFELQVLPTTATIEAGATVSYTLTLFIQKGFADQIIVNASGLPPGASYNLVASGKTVISAGPGTITMTLQITTTGTVKLGSYNVVVTCTGGGISHTQTVQLIVR
jgi:proteasome lid subunit RPN8/RPN11